MRAATRILAPAALAALLLGCPPQAPPPGGGTEPPVTPGGIPLALQGPAPAGPGQQGQPGPQQPAVAPPSQQGQGSPARSFLFPKVAPPAGPVAAPAEAPLSLTATDGTGLRLVRFEAKGVLEEPLAFTELHLAFENPSDRQMEGHFRIALPQNASISRFAMRLGDRWQEGEVLERQRARQVYEDFLHRKQDPALLEQSGGNEFSARVFPIPPRGVKELIVSYSQELPRAIDPYRIPLLGLPEVAKLDIRVLRSKDQPGGAAASSLGGATVLHETVEVNRSNWKPDRDFELPQAGVEGRLGLRHDDLVVARVTPVMGSQPDELQDLFVLFDTSASRALGFGRQVEQLGALVQGLAAGAGPQTPLAVACFDQEVMPIYDGPAGGFGAAELSRIRERDPLGASNLAGALGWLKGQLQQGRRFRRVLLVTDGVATAGETEGDRLRQAVLDLRQAEVERLDVLAVGGIRDDAVLQRLATAGLARDGKLLRAEDGLQEIGRRLSQQTRSGVKVAVEGAAWVWPSQLDGLQAGDEVLIYAEVPAQTPFALELGGVAMQADRRVLAQVERPLLERAWIKARMDRIEHQRDTLAAGDEDLRAALKKQVLDLSLKYRVLSPYTALLVLETEWDYQRYGIDRNSLADILTVGSSGVELLQRSAVVAAQDALDQVRRQPRPMTKGGPRRAAREGEREGRTSGQPGAAAASGTATLEDASAAARQVDEGEAEGEGKGEEEKPAEALKAEAAGSDGARFGLVGRGMGMGGGGAAAPRGLANLARGAAAPMAEDDKEEQAPEAAAPPPSAEPAPSMPSPAPVAATERLAEATGDLAGGGRPSAAIRRRRVPASPRPAPPAPRRDEGPKDEGVAPYTGAFKEVMDALGRKDKAGAQLRALTWVRESPGDVMALVALGEASEAQGDLARAARAYGSLIDLFPARADLRRFAGQRLERLALPAATELAVDTFRKAVEQRPDHPASHRLLGFALLRLGRAREAFDALAAGAGRSYPGGRFAGAERILREDLGLAAAAWRKAQPEQSELIAAKLSAAGGKEEAEPSLRFVLNWETDANDVDFHIHDGRGNHAYYGDPRLRSGGELYADVTTGYGPECFTIRGDRKQRAYPYRLQAHYYSRGPMGYGMGKLEIVEHDGKGGLRFEERPFVVMQDRAFVDLGTVKGPLGS